MRLILCFILFLFSINTVIAQTTIAQKMAWLAKTKPTSNLFVHFDKNVYTNNETVYFTGYLLKEAKIEINKHSLMAVVLVRDIDSTIIEQDKFLMQDGLSFGSITLPDSLLTGNYHFLVYTDKLINGNPEAIFNQPITLKTNIDPAIKASIKLTSDNGKSQKVLLSVTTKDNRFLPKPATINYRYGNYQKTEKTDASGQLLIALPAQANLTDPNIYAKLSYEKDTSFISMAMPQIKNKASVKFYPEGGNLVNGLFSYVGWEVKNQQKMPVALKAFLYKDNEVIDTIETSSFGIGKFRLLPENGSNYTVKLVHSNLADSSYMLPKALDNGITLNIQNAVVQDTLKIYLRSSGISKLNFLVHNFKEEYLNIPFDMGNRIRLVKIPLANVPKGLMTLTILDSLQRPLTERMFFTHHSESENLAINTDKKSYNQREKVSLKFKLTDTDANAIVSIACVQDNRLELNKINDIESYSYLKNELNYLPVNTKGSIYKDKVYLEQILLIKGWRRYTWQDLENVKAQDTLLKSDSLVMTGLVTKSKKELTAPVNIIAFGDTKIRMLVSATNGHFNFKNPELIMEQSRKNYLFVNDNNKNTYQFKVTDQFKNWNEKSATTILFDQPILPSILANNTDLVIKGNEKAIRLNEVVIKSNKNNSLHYGKGLPGSNECGDYVCSFNILNCRNHIGDYGNTQPVAGRSYHTNGTLTIYQECKTAPTIAANFLKFNGIHLQKQFYLDDYKDPQEPAFFSTIYWNYGVMLSHKNENQISFYTGDITGKFKIIAQGITNKDVIYAEQTFEVKPKVNP